MLKITEILKQSCLFKGLSEKQRKAIAQFTKIRQFFPEETIVWQGNASDSLYFITNGIVAVKKILSEENSQILAYLMPGQTFGEVGILENRPRSANVEAVSDVDVLVIQRKDFMHILHEFPSVAVELARMLGRYLIESNRRQSRKTDNVKVIIVFNLFESVGATTLGVLLSRFMQEKTNKSTIYTEYPNAQQLIHDFKLDKKSTIFHHELGYDIGMQFPNHTGDSGNFKTHELLGHLMGIYENIIITIKGNYKKKLSEDLVVMLDYADQILIPVPARKDASDDINHSINNIKKHIDIQEIPVYTILSQSAQNHDVPDISYDFELPYSKNFPSLVDIHQDSVPLPENVTEVINTFIDRLERTQQIAIFIPTTIDVNQEIDTQEYVDRTLNFLAEKFGGATSKEADGVWNSQEVGLVGEKVFIVHTYATLSDLNQYLDTVIDYVKTLKVELKQEAMALEVNQQLTLL